MEEVRQPSRKVAEDEVYVKIRASRLLAKSTVVAAVVLGGLLAAAAPASAAVDDTWWIHTTWPSGCSNSNLAAGTVRFVDYGPGAPGGGNNDDYLEIKDNCGDSAGVKAWAWLDGEYLGGKYNGNGANSKVTWDPFGNVKAGQRVGLKVCSVKGNAGTPYNCHSLTVASKDG